MQAKLEALPYRTEIRQDAKQSISQKPKYKNESKLATEPLQEPLQEEAVFLELSSDTGQVEQKTEEQQDAMKAWKEALDTLEQKREAQRLEQQQALAKESQATFSSGSSKPSDNAASLNKRLVAAISQMEVHKVISEANKDIVSLRMAAAMSGGEDAKAIQAIVRKLEKIITRGRRKVSDLNSEEGKKQQEVRARQQKQEKRAEEIKAELREQIRARKRREKKYLQEDDRQDTKVSPQQDTGMAEQKLDAATEAQIEAQAEMQVAAESAASGGADFGGGDMGAAGEASGPASGGEASGGSGGEVAAEGGGAEE